MKDIEEFRLSLRGLPVHYLRAGKQGEAMVLLHGGSRDEAWISWEPVLERLGSRFRLFAPDFPGFGKSGTPDSDCTLDYFVGFVEDFTAELNLERFVLVGLSLGGMVSLGFALQRPQAVKALVLVASAGLSREIRWRLTANLAARVPFLYRQVSNLVVSYRQLLKRALSFYLGRACSEELCRDLQKTIRERPAGAEGWESFLRSEVTWRGFRKSFREELGDLRNPTLLIHGARDGLIPVRHSIEAHRRIPHSRLEIFPNCGHWVPRSMPDPFVSSLVSFLGEVG